jgi:hypothetical protein
MAVVINDFEVVTERESNTRASNTPAAGSASQPATPTPREIEQLLRQQIERLARVKAH